MDREESIIIPCDCAGCCTIMRADRFHFGDPLDGIAFVEFYSRQGKASLRWRLKNAWNVLRGADPHSFDAISISPADQRRLGEFLLQNFEQKGERNGNAEDL